MPASLRTRALEALLLTDAARKAEAVRAIDITLPTGSSEAIDEPDGIPGRPARPDLVEHKRVPQRSMATVEGRAALIHSLAHIEFNAINLAADMAWRFADMPDTFYRDWIGVAQEEALHFQLLRAHLATLGFDYGHFPAHDGLWQMAHRTRHDLVARVVLVPRTLEARGLDATPPLQEKLRKAGDARAVEILDVILRDEVGHVAVGNRWYRWLCAREALEPMAHAALLANRYGAPRPRAPFNLQARLAAGFTREEIEQLNETAIEPRPAQRDSTDTSR